MTTRRTRTVELAESDRARIPFAVIGVLLLTISSVAVVSLETREEPDTDVDVAAAVDQLDSTTNSALREATTTGLKEAAAAPVTDASGDGAVEEAIQGDTADETFRNYARLRIYLAAREKLARMEQNYAEGVTASATLPPVESANVSDALDRVDMRAGYFESSMETGVVNVTIEDVTFRVEEEGGTETVQRSVDLTVPTTVFEMHDKTQEYQERLNTGFFEDVSAEKGYYGFGRKLAIRQYPVSWAKAYFDRLAPPGKFDDAFDPVHDHRTTEILANDAIFDVQKATFGTTDPYADQVRRERYTCLGLSTAYKVYDASSSDSGDDDEFNSTAANKTVDVYFDAVEDSVNTSSRDKLKEKIDEARNSLIGKPDPETAICTATKTLMRSDPESDFNFEAPPLSKIVSAAITDRAEGVDPVEQSQIEIEIDKFANGTYYNMTGDNSAEVAEKLEANYSESQNEGAEEVVDGDEDEDEDETSRTGDGPFDSNNIDVANDIYDVDLSVASATDEATKPTAPTKGGNWTLKNETYEVTDTGELQVHRTEGSDSTPANPVETDLHDVEMTLTNEIQHVKNWEVQCNDSEKDNDSIDCPKERDTTRSDREKLTFSVEVDIDAAHSPDADVERKGMDHAYDSGGPGPIGNHEEVKPGAIEEVFGASPDDLSSTLKTRVDEEEVLDVETLDEQLEYSKSASVNASLNESETDDLRAWLNGELDETKDTLNEEIDPLTLSHSEVAQNDSMDPLINSVRQKKEDLAYKDVSGTYANPADKTRAAVRLEYIEGVVDWLETEQEKKNEQFAEQSDELSSGIDGAGGKDTIGDLLSFASPDVLKGDVNTREGSLEGSPLYDDVEFVVDTSPTYLPAQKQSRSDVAAIRGKGSSPLEIDNSLKHIPMVTGYGNTPQHPGVPILPPGPPPVFYPNMWLVTVSGWLVHTEAQYPRFELRAEVSDPSTTEPTSYVRDDREVELELADGSSTAGDVEPISFSSNTVVAVAVPSKSYVATGKVGVGDTGSNVIGCKPTIGDGKWPVVGPEEWDTGDLEDCPEGSTGGAINWIKENS